MGAGFTSGGCCNCSSYTFCAVGNTCDGKPATVVITGGASVTGTGQACFVPVHGTSYTMTVSLDGYITRTATATFLHPGTWSGDADWGDLILQEEWWSPNCCLCYPTPETLNMTSADESCNAGMFRTGTITWQDTPSDIRCAFIDNMGNPLPPFPGYWGDQVWPEDVHDGSGNYVRTANFRYYLTCNGNLWTLTRVFTDPDCFRDAVLYSWVMGGYGNGCDPFHLDFGSAFPGSDLSCSVTIDGS